MGDRGRNEAIDPTDSAPRIDLRGALHTVLLGIVCVIGAACGGNAAAPEVALTPGVQEVDDCDTYAAHPDDPGRWAPGVPEASIVPGLAVQRCTDAVSDSPSTPRFHFQLGRALLQMGRSADARTAFQRAADLGYCPSKFYLGEAALLDSDGGRPERFDEAVKLFEAAEACSFAPATRRLNELGFSVDGFDAPKVMQALHDHDITSLNAARLPVALYLQGFQEYILMDFHPVSQACPALVGRAAVTYDLEAAAAGDSRLGALTTGVLSFILGLTPAPAKALIDPVYFADVEKFRTYFRGLGKRDGIDLIERLGGMDGGCTNPITQSIYRSVLEFAKAKRPVEEYAAELVANTTQLFGGLGVKHVPEPAASATP